MNKLEAAERQKKREDAIATVGGYLFAAAIFWFILDSILNPVI